MSPFFIIAFFGECIGCSIWHRGGHVICQGLVANDQNTVTSPARIERSEGFQSIMVFSEELSSPGHSQLRDI